MSRMLLRIGLLMLVTASPAWAQGEARIRVAHLSPDAPAVDILVDDAVAFANVAFEDVTAYAQLPPNTYNIKVVPTGQQTPVVIDVDLTLDRFTTYTVAATDVLAQITPIVLIDDNTLLRDSARIRFFHGSPDAPAVDVAVVNGPVLFSNVSFQQDGGYIEVPAGTYDLEVRLAGTQTVVLSLPGISVTANKVYTAYAKGLVGGNPDLGAIISLDRRCFLDVTDDGVVDIVDLQIFYLIFLAADPSADVNGDGVINLNDFFSFYYAFAARQEDCNFHG